jgi:hypothetical protein
MTETAKLRASSPEQNNNLGTSIVVSGNGSVVALGCYNDNIAEAAAGSIYVFTEPPGVRSS